MMRLANQSRMALFSPKMRSNVGSMVSRSSSVSFTSKTIRGSWAIWPRQPRISPDCIFVLAAGTIESTRLALDSLQAPAMGAKRMGSNLMAHLRSDITAQIRRSAIPGLPSQPTELEMAALLVRGTTSDGHEYHMQVTASAGGSSDANLFAAVPDLDLLNALRANQDPGWI